MAATFVGIYHSICGKESYLNSVNILQTMAVAICNSFKHACLQRESLFSVEVPTHPKEVEDPLQLIPVQLCREDYRLFFVESCVRA